jgi:uncharacterized protein involved in exopolysaccharide biosynthesis
MNADSVRYYVSQRRFWAVWLGVAALVVGVAWIWPRDYEASTLIIVNPQSVPDRFVQSSVTADTASRLALIQQYLMSSARLTRIIQTYGLYKHLQGRKSQEEIVERMRGSISIEVVNPGRLSGFRISFRYHQPSLVAQVTNQLASLFIEENLKFREGQSEGTAELLERQLTALGDRLEAAARQRRKSAVAETEFTLLRDEYAALFRKKLEAERASDLERRQKSERFTIMDPARIPEQPRRPSLPLTLGVGLVVGLLSGLTATGLGPRPAGEKPIAEG